MLTEKRQEEILKLLDTRGSLTVQELTEYFQASESTIRRDLTVLDKKGALVKVFGGAVQKEKKLITREEKVSLRMELYREEKLRIGRYAASLIAPDDFVYLDAGTTTGCIIPYLTEHSASFVTNAVSHALQLAEHGFRVILIGGELKSSTMKHLSHFKNIILPKDFLVPTASAFTVALPHQMSTKRWSKHVR